MPTRFFCIYVHFAYGFTGGTLNYFEVAAHLVHIFLSSGYDLPARTATLLPQYSRTQAGQKAGSDLVGVGSALKVFTYTVYHDTWRQITNVVRIDFSQNGYNFIVKGVVMGAHLFGTFNTAPNSTKKLVVRSAFVFKLDELKYILRQL